MYRPLTRTDLNAIAAELVGTDNDLQVTMGELGLDLYHYGVSDVLAWLRQDYGLVLVDDRWVLE